MSRTLCAGRLSLRASMGRMIFRGTLLAGFAPRQLG
jgi:hypothetical protein